MPVLPKHWLSRRHDVLAGIDDTEPRVEMVLDDNYVAAIIKLHDYADTYMYIARVLDPRVLAQLRDARWSCPLRRPCGAPDRHSDRLWLDVHGDCADRPALGGLDWT